MSGRQQSAALEALVYRHELTGVLLPLGEALDASRVNALTYEADLEVIATYGMEDPGDGDGLWPI